MNGALNFLFPQRDKVWLITLLGSLVAPLLILLLKPLDLTLSQSSVLAVLLLVITWWSTGTVKKIPSSLFLLLCFLLFSGAPAQVVFTFPLSETFFLILLTYVFSQGIANSFIMDKLITPRLMKYVKTPVQTLLAMVGVFYLSMYLIPQPLARLILIASLFKRFLDATEVPKATVHVLMFGLFLMYGAVNMSTRNADIILNNAAVSFAGLSFSDADWIAHMLVPTLFYLVLILSLFILLFKKHLLGIRLHHTTSQGNSRLNRTEKAALVIAMITVLLWVTQSMHHISAIWITLAANLAFAAIGVIKWKDLKAIDISTLVFLTAAFCIGGVLKHSGTAEVLFSQINSLLPTEPNTFYLLAIVLIAMLMHLILGSNTTTLSVVVPSLVILTGSTLPPNITMLLSVIGVCFHSVLPFHSVALMIGVGNDYFPARLVPHYGIPATLLVFAGALLLYVPWWRLMGYV